MKRLYLVRLKLGTRKPIENYLVEARSQEEAIKSVTAPLVESVTIPTPLEAFKLQQEGAQIISPSLTTKPAEPEPQGDGEGVGRLGLSDAEPPEGS